MKSFLEKNFSSKERKYTEKTMSTSKKNAPFGSKAPRFGKITLHPNLDKSGLYAKRPIACDPGLYRPNPLHKICENTSIKMQTKDPWRYKNELEDWARNLGYRNQRVLRERKWYKSILGPAWYEIPEMVKEPTCKNLGFGRTPRFRPSRNILPGPGTYYKTKPYKAPYGPHSTKPSFERGEPCRFKDKFSNLSLAPNRYTIIDKECIEEKPKKVVSLRGPYDLFTGSRDTKSKKCFAATWPLMLKSTLTKYENTRYGIMNKTNRDVPYRGRNALVDLSLCLKRSSDPGPAQYNICKSKTFKENVNPFNSSYDKPPGYIRALVWPGVGRYNVKYISCGDSGHRHVFISKQGRTIGAILPEEMNSF